MSSLSEGLNDRLLSPNESGFDPAPLVPLLRLLAKGEPVPVTSSPGRPGAASRPPGLRWPRRRRPSTTRRTALSAMA